MIRVWRLFCSSPGLRRFTFWRASSVRSSRPASLVLSRYHCSSRVAGGSFRDARVGAGASRLSVRVERSSAASLSLVSFSSCALRFFAAQACRGSSCFSFCFSFVSAVACDFSFSRAGFAACPCFSPPLSPF